MDFKQIEAFVNVVRYKSFSKAADAMFFSQPTISAHIQSIENELGVKLLDRTGREIEMTPQGQQFYQYAVEMVNMRARAIEEMDQSHKEQESILEIQTSSVPAITFLPALISGFRAEHRKTRFFVESSDSGKVIDNIRNRRGEVGFVGEKVDRPELSFEPIFRDQVVLVAPASFDMGDEITLEEAVNLPFVWRELGSATRKVFEEVAAQHRIDINRIHIVAEFSDMLPIIRSVEHGLGVTILSARTACDIMSDKLKIVQFRDTQIERTLYMVTLKSEGFSPVAEAFVKYVREHQVLPSDQEES